MDCVYPYHWSEQHKQTASALWLQRFIRSSWYDGWEICDRLMRDSTLRIIFFLSTFWSFIGIIKTHKLSDIISYNDCLMMMMMLFHFYDQCHSVYVCFSGQNIYRYLVVVDIVCYFFRHQFNTLPYQQLQQQQQHNNTPIHFLIPQYHMGYVAWIKPKICIPYLELINVGRYH